MTVTEIILISLPIATIVFSLIWYFWMMLTESKWWCDTFHGGGSIKHDPSGRLNWQCDQCKRWHL